MKLMVTAFLIFLHKETDGSQRPMDMMADLTNDLGVCILQVQSTLQNGNVAFSPYGLASMSILLFEGAAGNSAFEISSVMKLPWNTLLARIGFRDINRHLKTYFKSDGFLRGLIMSRDDVCFHPTYQKVLRLYGFDEPETALTYPCAGFIPYSPPPTNLPPSTTESVNASTISTPENKTSAIPTDEIVTELTQTSQTVAVRNNLTNSPTIVAVTPRLAQTETQSVTEYFLSTLEADNTVAMPPAEPITAEFSNTVPAVPANGDAIEPRTTAATITEWAAPTSGRTIKVEKFNSTPTTIGPLQNASETSIKNDLYFFTTTINPNDSFDQNFTLTYTDFTFSSTDASQTTTLGPLFSDLTTSTLTPDTSTIFLTSLGFSPANRLNITTNFTLPALFNDSSLEDLEFTTLDPFITSFEETDFNKSTTFFNTLVDSIGSTTQTTKEVSSTTVESPSQSTAPIPTGRPALRDTNGTVPQNTIDVLVPRNVTTARSNAALRSSQLQFDMGRVNGENVDSLISRKKSMSDSDDNLSSSINIAAESKTVRSSFKTPPNYVNVLSVKQSKAISSKYDVRSVKGSRERFIRNVPVPNHNNTAEIRINFTETPKQVQDNMRDGTQAWGSPTIKGNFSTHFSSFTAQSQGQIAIVGSTAAYAEVRGVNSDVRSIRSFGHDSHHTLNADWFATPDQNMIRVPVFSYSAMLPFTYIDDMKSKILEIPLDDYNYSLLVILPAPGFGIDRLLHSLTRISLRRIWNLLRPTPVYASVPKFSIISHINLRNALYTLGVRDIFHRYRSDLSLMSPDSKLFLRSIEQVVTIYVDKFPSSVYPVPEKYVEQRFSATHPFLYFVMDRNSGVSLVAGILSNPAKHII